MLLVCVYVPECNVSVRWIHFSYCKQYFANVTLSICQHYFTTDTHKHTHSPSNFNPSHFHHNFFPWTQFCLAVVFSSFFSLWPLLFVLRLTPFFFISVAYFAEIQNWGLLLDFSLFFIVSIIFLLRLAWRFFPLCFHSAWILWHFCCYCFCFTIILFPISLYIRIYKVNFFTSCFGHLVHSTIENDTSIQKEKIK